MFDDYYSKYMSIDNGTIINGCMVCKSNIRNNPINNRFIYRVIITDYRGIRIISTSPTISDSLIREICNDIKDKKFDDILESQTLCKNGLRVSKMYRMEIDDSEIYQINNFHSDLKLEYISENRKYVFRDKQKIVSYCKISNIDYNFGNIVVWTDENFRRKGYAKELLFKSISRCNEEGIEPVYLVNCQNTASIDLAKSVGFKTVQNEIVACEVLN